MSEEEVIIESHDEDASEKEKQIISYDLSQIKGIGPIMIQKFAEEGILGIDGLAYASSVTVAEATGKSIDWATELIKKCKKYVDQYNNPDDTIETAEDGLEKLMKRKKIVTGIEKFDALLGGGIETCCITEFFGGYASGKSQTCFTLAVLATLPEDQGGLDGNTLYIDVEGTFAPDRVLQIIKARGLPESTMKKILRKRPQSSGLLVDDIKKIPKMIEKHNIKLIVIDSIIMLHGQEYVGRGLLAARQQSLGYIMMMLLKIAELYEVAIVITNQIRANPGANVMFGQKPYNAAGGNVISHATSTRIELEKLTKRIKCSVRDSPRLAGNECMVALNEKGIDNYVVDLKKKEEL